MLAIAEHKKGAPTYAQKLAKEARSLDVGLGRDEFEILEWKNMYAEEPQVK